MSIQTFDDLVTKLPFPMDKNVRVLITGLAFCKFTSPLSTIEFLRHVPHHELTMNIIQMKKSDSNYTKAIMLKIEKMQNVEILGAAPNQTSNNVRDVVGMTTIHGHPIRRRATNDLPTDLPTFLRLENCIFFTFRQTEKRYFFLEVIIEIQ